MDMKYENVENARKVYIDKYNNIKYKTLLITSSIMILFVVWLLAANSGQQWQKIIFHPSNLPYALLAVLPVLLVVVFCPVILAFAFGQIFTVGELKNYKKFYKAYFIEKQLANVFTDIEYSHDKGLEQSLLMHSGMIDTGDKYSSNDYVSGKYNNVGFRQADVEIKKERKNADDKRTYETIFKGRYMIFEFPKKFNSRLMLSHYASPFVTHSSTDEAKVLHNIKMESEEFNKAFMTYAEDDMEAFYILTPDFMECALALGKVHNNKVSLYFHDNKMIVGINDGNDVFEPPNPKAPIDEKQETERVDKEMRLITHIIDNLKLNR